MYYTTASTMLFSYTTIADISTENITTTTEITVTTSTYTIIITSATIRLFFYYSCCTIPTLNY